MAVKSLRILLAFFWPGGQITRIWDGSGPYLDSTGNLWRGASILTALETIEQTLNGDAAALTIGMTGVPLRQADDVWQRRQDGSLIDASMQILLQSADDADQPVGDPKVMFQGRVDNVVFSDRVEGERPTSTISVIIVSKFVLRRLLNGASLSDADQRARSAVLNPGAAPDRFCERIVMLQQKTIVWPRFS